MILLIHPQTGDIQIITRQTPDPRGTFRYLVLDGYKPVGPRCQKIAETAR